MPLPPPEQWRQLSPLLDELLELDATAREQRLNALRAEQPALAQALADLLAQGGQAARAGFLTGSVAGLASAQPAGASLAGQQVGAYQLEAPLGQGGSGTVWRARRADGRFESAVAVKLLHLSMLGQAGEERFRREGQLLARLQHPHIARLLDAGVMAGTQPYLVLELVQGQRLDRHCEALHLDVRARLLLFRDVLRAVQHAHSHLIIHRDIKPSNILVTPEGAVKLLDFGIAKLLAAEEDDAAPSTDLTRDWGRAMTPEYAAPEQLQGLPITIATDVYALGTLLYELLVGQLPFPQRRRHAGRQLPAPGDDAPAPLPSATAADAALRRQLRGDLDIIIGRALKSAPAERYPTVDAMLDNVQRHLDGRPLLARADAWTYRARKWVLRHRGASAVGVGVVLALVGGAYAQVAVLLALAVGTLVALWQAREARSQAQAAREAQQRAERVKQFIASIFTGARPRDGEGGVVTAADLLAAAAERIEAELGAHPAVAGELGVLVAASYSALGDPALGVQALQTALPRCQQTLGPKHLLTLQARVLQLEGLNFEGRLPEATALAPALLADLRAELASCRTAQAPSLAELLVGALREASFEAAKREDEATSLGQLHEAVACAEQRLGPSHDETLTTLGLLANTFQHFGRINESLAPAETAYRRALQALGPLRPHGQLATTERWYADALLRVGRPADAEPIARQVVLDQQALDVVPTLRVVNACSVHALALFTMGRVGEALALAQDVERQHTQLQAQPTPNTAAFAVRVWLCLVPMRREAEIHAACEREIEAWRCMNRPEPLRSRLRRGRLQARLAAWNGDLAAVDQGIAAMRAQAGDQFAAETARLPILRALALRLLGRDAEALAAVEQGLVGCRDQPGALSDHAYAKTEHAWHLQALGRRDESAQALREAAALYDSGQVGLSLVRTDEWLLRAMQQMHGGDAATAAGELQRLERCWAEGHAGSVWHAQVQWCWAQALRACGGDAGGLSARTLEQQAAPVLAASKLPAMRAYLQS